jgi:hypothetical protein
LLEAAGSDQDAALGRTRVRPSARSRTAPTTLPSSTSSSSHVALVEQRHVVVPAQGEQEPADQCLTAAGVRGRLVPTALDGQRRPHEGADVAELLGRQRLRDDAATRAPVSAPPPLPTTRTSQSRS